jgi:hypothetical protein
MNELLVFLIWWGVVLHICLWFKTPQQMIANRAGFFSVDTRRRVSDAQLDLMAGRAEAAAQALDKLTDEMDEILGDLEEARLEAENGFVSEAICRIERLLNPSRAAA